MTDTATENKAKREAIIRKVRALLAKTTENGAGEAEAMAAAEKAADLMREHDLAYTDITAEVEADRYGARRRPWSTHPIAINCTVALCAYWGVKWAADDKNNLVFFGTADDTESAFAMLELLRVAADTEFAKFWQSPSRPYQTRFNTARASFMTGFTGRAAKRLADMKKDRDTATGTGSRSLVVVKDQVVARHFETFRRGEKVQSKSSKRKAKYRDEASFGAGRNAADRTNIAGRAARIGSG